MILFCFSISEKISLLALAVSSVTAVIYMFQLSAIRKQGALIENQSSLFQKQLKLQADVENDRILQRRRDLTEKYIREQPDMQFDSFSLESNYTIGIVSYNWIWRYNGQPFVIKSALLSNNRITFAQGTFPFYTPINDSIRLSIALIQENKIPVPVVTNFTFTILKGGMEYYIQGHHNGIKSIVNSVTSAYSENKLDTHQHVI